MDDRTRFLILSLGGEDYALPIARLLEITVPRNIQKEAKLTELFEGKIDYRGKLVPVLNLKKVLKLGGEPGATMLVVSSSKGMLGLLVDSVTEILDTEQRPAPLPQGIVNPSHAYYGGVLRYKENLVLLLNEDGLLP
jgi:chemotaxis signal transduction protein